MAGRDVEIARLKSELADALTQRARLHAPALSLARSRHARPNLTFIEGDMMTHAFPSASFDFIASIATLHHLPLEPALQRFRDLLRPDGVLVIVGLYRLEWPTDYIIGGVATIVSVGFRVTRGIEHVNAPTRDPEMTLREVSAAVERVLPGAILKRRLFYRYSFVWRKPS